MFRLTERQSLWIWLAALWPVWAWYLARTVDGSDEPWGLLPLLVLLTCRLKPRLDARWMYAGLLACAAGSALPPLVRALLVAVCVGAVVAPGRPGASGLLLLSMPLVASLNFYLGYPLRRLSAGLAVAVLQAEGRNVQLHGVLLWDGTRATLVDAPCSGIETLWWTLLLACLVATWRRLELRATLGLTALAAMLAVVGNSWRLVTLMYVGPCSPALHEGIGLIVFAATAGAVIVVGTRLKGSGADATPVPFSPGRTLMLSCLVVALTGSYRIVPATTIDTITETPGRVLRQVHTATRSLHPASDCYRAMGYTISPQDAVIHDGHMWSCFTARRGDEIHCIEQSIWDTQGHSWSDVSQWYWAALLGQTQAPWFTETTQR